jgi:hypothetical protein
VVYTFGLIPGHVLDLDFVVVGSHWQNKDSVVDESRRNAIKVAVPSFSVFAITGLGFFDRCASDIPSTFGNSNQLDWLRFLSLHVAELRRVCSPGGIAGGHFGMLQPEDCCL